MSLEGLSTFFKKMMTLPEGSNQIAPGAHALYHFEAKMTAMETWRTLHADPHPSVEQTVSGAIWKSIPGGHKWLDYFKAYDRELSRFRDKQPKVLEIGVYKGASLKLWKAFFGHGATIVGVDIDEACRTYADEGNRVFVEIGSQADNSFMQSVVERYGPFDVVIDDGSHVASHQIASFNSLFPSGLKNGGLYLVEDLECMYWGHTDVFRDCRITSVEFFKALVDIQNSVFSDYEYNDFAPHVGTQREEYSVISLAKIVDTVKFYRGVVIVEKNEQHPPVTLHL